MKLRFGHVLFPGSLISLAGQNLFVTSRHRPENPTQRHVNLLLVEPREKILLEPILVLRPPVLNPRKT